jgi:hypothetical protein
MTSFKKGFKPGMTFSYAELMRVLDPFYKAG